MRAPGRGNIRGRERRARPAPRGDVKDVHAVVVRRALSAADNDDLAANERRSVRATRRRQVALHIRMRPLHRLCEGGRPRFLSSRIGPRRWGARTDIETPHVFEAPSVVAAAEYPRHVVGESDGVRAEAVGRERPPNRGLAPVHHGRGRRLDARRVWQMGDCAEARGGLLQGCAREFVGGSCCRLASGGGKRG